MVPSCPSEEELLLYLEGQSADGGRLRAHVMTCDTCRELVSIEARAEPLFGGKYAIERELGAGGMGRVVLARHVKLDKMVAIKMIHADYLHEKKVVERFSREARAAAMLKSPHVVQVVDIDTADGEPYIVMEYLRGIDLGSKVAAEGALPIADAVRFVREACHALAEAHAAGIIHRDVKPANLFLTDSGIVKVLDFGLAKALPHGAFSIGNQTSLTTKNDLLGSPRYMSPEQFDGEVDHRTDIWSIGVTLYFLLCGQPPFSGNELSVLRRQITNGEAIPLASRRPEVPRHITAAVERCLAASREDRWSSIDDFTNALGTSPPKERVLVRSLPFDVGRYSVLRQIAAGGMGTVYLGRSRGALGFSRPVALKQLHPHLATSEAIRRRFLAEAKIVSQIAHPHVVKVLDVVEDEAEVFLVLEYVHGETLQHLLHAAGAVEPSVVAAIFCHIAEALHAAHEAVDESGAALGIVHRDVSPHNVLVAKQGAAYVTDFGVAKVRAHLGETHSGVMGKTGYMAPEQLRGESVTRAADIYAIGVMLWEALARQRLFGGGASRDKTPVGPSSIEKTAPRELDALVLSMLAMAPGDRPPTALVVARTLRQLVTPASDEEVGAWMVSLAQKKLDGLEIVLAAEWGPTTPAGLASKTLVDSAPPLTPPRPGRRSRAPWLAATAVAMVSAMVAGKLLRAPPVVAAPAVPVASSVVMIEPAAPVVTGAPTLEAAPAVTASARAVKARRGAPAIQRTAPVAAPSVAPSPPTSADLSNGPIFPSIRK